MIGITKLDRGVAKYGDIRSDAVRVAGVWGLRLRVWGLDLNVSLG